MPIIKKWLYSDKDIFLREIVANGIDAITKYSKLVKMGEAENNGTEYCVKIFVDKKAKTLTVEDNGIGMTEEEVENYITQIAFSGASDFLSKYEKAGGDGIIGHFGLGFYSAYMVSENVEIFTKSYKDVPAVHWESDGNATYSIEECDRKDRGTKIVMHISAEEKEFLEESTIKELVRKYCSFMPFNVYVSYKGDGKDEPCACDVLNFISKDFEKGKMFDGPKFHEYVKELFGREKVRGIFTVGECSFGKEGIPQICGEDRDELKCIFQFEHFYIGQEGKFCRRPYKIDEARDILVKWQNFYQDEDLPYTLFTDNHDNAHYISRLGNDGKYRYECATMYAVMFYLLRGIPFIYQGQEYGSPDPRYSDIKDFDDVETFNYFEANKNLPDVMDRINYGSRDNVRRPVCWNGGKNYGFSSAGKAWITLHSRGEEVNLERDVNSEKSVFAFYKKVLALRKESGAVRHGRFTDLTAGEGYFAYERSDANESILAVCNFENPTSIEGLPCGEYLFGNGAKRRDSNGSYAPYETAVFRIKR